MKFTIEKFREISFIENKKEIKLQGYAFKDSLGNCICIVYGESRRDLLKSFLEK